VIGERPIRLRDQFCVIMTYCNLSIFNMAAVRHFGTWKLKFLTANHFGGMFCVIALNFVEIGQTSADISHFSCFLSEI